MECEGDWAWETCSLCISFENETSCTIKARGDLGWRVEVTYSVNNEDKSFKSQTCQMVCQPLQVFLYLKKIFSPFSINLFSEIVDI